MNDHSEHGSSADLDPIAAQLRASRDELSCLELDAVRQRIHVRAGSRPNPSRRHSIMKSRLAVTAMLVLGMLFSTAGAGLAVSGLASSGDNASEVQYDQVTTTPRTTPPPTQRTPREDTDVLGEIGEVEEEAPAPAPQSGSAPQAAPQPAQQLQATQPSGELPFTGFVAIPVLIGGIALLTSGLVLRRRTREDDADQQ